jgi:biotin carboxyl carrier protein
MIELVSIDAEEAEIRVDGRMHIVPYVIVSSTKGSTVNFAFDGEIYFIEIEEKGRARARHRRDHSTEAPMPGVVLRILVREGDVVAKGAPLLILEAMKMEHQISAGHDGAIVSVNCREGELVQTGVELVTLSEG